MHFFDQYVPLTTIAPLNNNRESSNRNNDDIEFDNANDSKPI